jgi:iron complex transport system substrate-binding protein
VGALVDPDVERILALRPQLVVAYATQDELRAQLQRAGIESFVYRHHGLADIPATMRALGKVTGDGDGAEKAASAFEARVGRVREAAAGRPRPRTLLVFGRDPGSLRNVYASGGTGFLHDALQAAGGDNVFADVARESVQVSTELILARAPEVIVELRTSALLTETGGHTAPWQRLASVPAVRRGRVHVLSGDYLVVPGPRMADAVEALARALRP